MKLRFMPEAEEALFELASWVEERNTPGSGSRYLDKFIGKIEAYALSNATYGLCKNKVLASQKLSCLAINDWVIAFKQTTNEFVVHYVLYGAGLK